MDPSGTHLLCGADSFGEGTCIKCMIVQGIISATVENHRDVTQTEGNGRTSLEKGQFRDFPGSSVVKTLCFQHKGCVFSPWVGNKEPTCCMTWPRKRKEGAF